MDTFFTGNIDEVIIFDRVLTAEEIYALAQSGISGGGSVQTALEPVDFDQLESGAIVTPTLDWQYAEIHDPETTFSTWSTTITVGLEDFYQIRLRGEDLRGYISPERLVWRGVIDTLAPRVTHTARLIGQGASAATEYAFHADDLFLDPDSLVTACAGSVVFSTYANPERINGASLTCRVPGHITASATATACDYSGHCASALSSFAAAIIIESPDGSDIVTVGTATAIAGTAYDPDGLQSVAVLVNGAPITTLPFPGTNVQANWSANWTPTAVGTYTITARMTDQGGNALTDTVIVAVQPPGSTPDSAYPYQCWSARHARADRPAVAGCHARSRGAGDLRPDRPCRGQTRFTQQYARLTQPDLVMSLVKYAFQFQLNDVFLTDGLIWHPYSNFQPTNTKPTAILNLTTDNPVDVATYLVQQEEGAQVWANPHLCPSTRTKSALPPKQRYKHLQLGLGQHRHLNINHDGLRLISGWGAFEGAASANNRHLAAIDPWGQQCAVGVDCQEASVDATGSIQRDPAGRWRGAPAELVAAKVEDGHALVA